MKNLHDENHQNLVMKNIRLVPYVLSKMQVKQQDYNDWLQVGNIGLIKAARTFDPSKSKFSSYAISCIRNEIYMYLRNERKEGCKVYIQDEFTVENKDSLSYEELMEDRDAQFSDRLEYCESIETILSIILNRMKKREKLLILYNSSELRKRDVSKIFNTSRQYLYELQQRAQKRLYKLIKDNTTDDYKKRYEVKAVLETYSILLIINDIENKQVFSNINELNNKQKLEGCSIKCKDNKIMVKMPMDLSCLYTIAQIVQIVEEFY